MYCGVVRLVTNHVHLLTRLILVLRNVTRRSVRVDAKMDGWLDEGTIIGLRFFEEIPFFLFTFLIRVESIDGRIFTFIFTFCNFNCISFFRILPIHPAVDPSYARVWLP